MKILFTNMLDPDYVKGHKNLDKKIINALIKFSSVDVLCPNAWYDTLPSEVGVVDLVYDEDAKGRNRTYEYAMSVIKQAYELDRRNAYDYIFFASFHTYLMVAAYIRLSNSRSRVYVMQHNNIDLVDNYPKYRIVYNLYARRVNHFVLGEFIRKHLIEIHKIPAQRVFNIPHPIVNPPKQIDYSKKKYDCVAISNSNDEQWIESLLALELDDHFFSNNDLRVVLRSKSITFDSEYLKIISGFMPIKEYQEYYQGAKAIFLPFPSSYGYRMSASLIDAVTNGSVVFCTKIPLIDYYSKKYPSLCKTIRNIDELKHEMLNLNTLKIEDAVMKFVNDHDDIITLEALRSAFFSTKNEQVGL